MFRAGHDHDAGSTERSHVVIDDLGPVASWDQLGAVDTATQQAVRQRLRRILKGADRRRAVGQNRVAGNATQVEDEPVGVVERDCRFGNERRLAGLHEV